MLELPLPLTLTTTLALPLPLPTTLALPLTTGFFLCYMLEIQKSGHGMVRTWP